MQQASVIISTSLPAARSRSRCKMKVLLAAINAKYIHSNLGIYSLKTYGEKMLKEWGLAEQAEISGRIHH